MKFNKNFNLFIIFLSCYELANSAKILAIFPYPGPSQYILVQPYLKALAFKGHEMTVINAHPQTQQIKNYRDILVMDVHQDYEEFIKSLNARSRSAWGELTYYADFYCNISQTVLKSSAVQDIIKKESYDLVIVEALNLDAIYALAKHFEAPLIGVSSFGTDFIIDDLMGNVSPFAYAPLHTLGFTENMSFSQRLQNMHWYILSHVHNYWVHVPKQQHLVRKYLPHLTYDLWQIRSNFSLMLLNQHFSLSFARPYVPNMIEIGGFHVETKSSILPSTLNTFLNSSPYTEVIYFSLGSNMKSKHLSSSVLSLINEVFGSLPYKILWKFEDSHLTNKADNVFISAWFPQTDILASPRVKLFITHGGLLSTIESIYHGKPLLGLPLFYDQETNVNRAQQMGFALSLDIKNLTKASFRETILEMMTNNKYEQKVKEISQIYHDQPIKPIDLAIYWTEYILRHRGAYHMQTKAQKMSFARKHSLDILAVMVTGAFAVVIVCCCLIIKFIKAKVKKIMSNTKQTPLKKIQ
uniref:UDP-glucuronosyltransferase n=1 Tax=Glossina morsitans morsitans TaxID=37546 RepID=D3TPK4_GLOMM